MGRANGSRECAPDDRLRETHRLVGILTAPSQVTADGAERGKIGRSDARLHTRRSGLLGVATALAWPRFHLWGHRPAIGRSAPSQRSLLRPSRSSYSWYRRQATASPARDNTEH